MTKVLVLYYSAYGHIATMARAAAEGARAAGAEVTVLRVPESLDGATARAAGIVADPAPVAAPADLERFDAILFGTPTHFGTMAGQMKAFIDSCGGLWARDALVGKVAGVFTASQSQHGGQEHTLLSTQAALLHLGFVIVGLPYTFKGQTRMDEITGGSPYGATTLTGAADGGSRPPSATELDGARFQGRHIAETAAALAAGRRAKARAPEPA